MQPHELELGPDEMRRLVDLAMSHLVPHVASLGEQPASDVEGAMEVARTVPEPMPEHGSPPEPLFERLFGELIPKSYNAAGPGYMAYIPGGGLFHAAVADLVADGINRYVGVVAPAPALAALEATVVRWFADMIGMPRTARGLLTTGGSMANLVALVTARRTRLPEDFLKGTIYASDQVHHSITKAAILAGFPASRCRSVPTDASFRIDLAALDAMIAADRAAGLTPFFVVGSAGTTNTGSIDDLDALADVAAREGLFFHVDGAYGGFFLLTERGRRAMKGIERADSVTLDPHKALFLPYGTGSLVVRDGAALRRAHESTAAYLPEMQDDDDLVDFCEHSPELSRAFRGLRVWLPMKMHGASTFRRYLDEKLDLAAYAHERLTTIPHLEIVCAPALTAIAFRFVVPGLSDAELDALNARIADGASARKRVLLKGTVLRGRFVIRMCIVSFRTHRDRVDMALEDLAAAARDALL
jgi:aromatic-L-amino-acid decarboxylase